MTKTTLNKWLKGKVKLDPNNCLCSNCTWDQVIEDAFYVDGYLFFIDVLDDGTAITYTPNK